uniref:NudC domain-containing protein 1 n=1 Tax=Cricetulus griseus TaxID=10029 RepID=A0A8C2MI52_CRIGR
MEAANCSLRVKRPLLDPRFEGYKLSLEPLPCYQLELDAAVAEVKLRDDQYTLEHMHAFGMYNYLHCDAWYQDSVYYIDNLGRIMNLTVMLVRKTCRSDVQTVRRAHLQSGDLSSNCKAASLLNVSRSFYSVIPLPSHFLPCVVYPQCNKGFLLFPFT